MAETALSSTTLFRIACGGQGGLDLSNNLWAPDGFFVGGQTWINAPGQENPLKNLRFNPSFSYTIPAAPGTYNLTFYFLEPNKTGAGQRLLSVTVNSLLVIDNLDIFGRVGVNKPFTYTVQVKTTDPNLLIEFTGILGNAVVSGIQVDKLDTSATFNSLITYEGFIDHTDLTSDAFEQEITILQGLPGEFLFFRVTLEVVTRFLGHTTFDASMGRPGTNHNELFGGFVAMDSPDGYFWQTFPGSPQLHDHYDIVVAFKSTGSSVAGATTGKLRWQICGFLPMDIGSAQANLPQRFK